MKVILLQDVDNLGKKGELKQATPGYVRNFLLPQGLAEIATKQAIVKLEQEQELKAQQAEQELKQAEELVVQIDGLELEMPVKASQQGKAFGGITAKNISDKLVELGYQIAKEQVKLKKPLKEIGEHEVALELEHGLEANIKVVLIEELSVKLKI